MHRVLKVIHNCELKKILTETVIAVVKFIYYKHPYLLVQKYITLLTRHIEP